MHPIERVSSSPVFHKGRNILKKNFVEFDTVSDKDIVINSDIWIGAGVTVLSGVTIGVGAVVGAGSVVTHDIPPYEIWAGNPAKKIRNRFDEKVTEDLLKTKWWEWDDEKIEKYAYLFDKPIRSHSARRCSQWEMLLSSPPKPISPRAISLSLITLSVSPE